ncbi:MAG TPA: hypothetical protein VF421_20230, partial [Niabella sp.]
VRGSIFQDDNRALRFFIKELVLQLFIVYLYRLYHMKVGSKPLKGILLSVKMGFFYAPTLRLHLLQNTGSSRC